ncbi:MAG: Asp-tRNA(Asn)/Glu-tRNA(Gln) amidotransferase subunit GatB [Gammaproteobacteria bacterium]|nr:Asp-tRNA(Asn)/Glu-tRNA(Gln) amidotransferase subunit GatB [Gammaproteobacteria bacterium]MYE81442.1 Asp-tRNA(Asn)/Glu-tRNA(Gln) amidotransferase subunit GatB [Gammaproteobacteria bacterium]
MPARDWESVIGLEIHVQLATRSKIFSGADAAFGAAPNTRACAVDLGMPGVLPVLNREAVRMALTFGLAIDAEIARTCRFDRKNYFYPDLPKGYQISQFDQPIVGAGVMEMEVDGATRRIGIRRAHLEEDAGKSLHEEYADMTGIDLNRAGTPLLEVVSEPDLRTPAEAAAFFREMHALVRYLGICDGNLNEGSMRCDANVSVRRRDQEGLGERTEIKNLNSFRFVRQAIAHEIDRQIAVLESGGSVVRETRLYDPRGDETRPMRGKELSEDYRYFPDPDLLPVRVTPDLLAEARARVPELPRDKRRRYREELGLSDADTRFLTADPDVAGYFEATLATGCGAKPAANWIMERVTGSLNRTGLDIARCPVTSGQLGRLIARIEEGVISGKIAGTVFDVLWEEGGDVDAIIDARGLRQVSDADEIGRVVREVVNDHPEQVEQFRAGREKVLGFFVGRVMRATGGKADPGQVNVLLRDALRGP